MKKQDSLLRVLLVPEYEIEKDFFYEKIGSGDFYRECLEKKYIIEKHSEDTQITYFSLNSDEYHVDELTANEYIRYSKKYIEYYTMRLEEFEYTTDYFTKYAYRCINLISHYDNVGQYDSMVKVIDKIGLYLYKWGFNDQLESMISKLLDVETLSEEHRLLIEKYELLYKIESVKMVLLSDPVKKNVLENAFDKCGFDGCLAMLKLELNIYVRDILKFFKKMFNRKTEIDRFICYQFVKSIKGQIEIPEAIKNIDFKYNDSNFYIECLIEETDEAFDLDLVDSDDDYALLQYFENHLKRLYLRDEYSDEDLNEIIKYFATVYVLHSRLSFDNTKLFFDLCIFFMNLEDQIEIILYLCENMAADDILSKYASEKRFFNNLHWLYKGELESIKEIKHPTHLDKLFLSYKEFYLVNIKTQK